MGSFPRVCLQNRKYINTLVLSENPILSQYFAAVPEDVLCEIKAYSLELYENCVRGALKSLHSGTNRLLNRFFDSSAQISTF